MDTAEEISAWAELDRGSPALRAAFREAFEEPVLGQIVLRTAALSGLEQAMILEMINKLEELGQWSTEMLEKARERLPDRASDTPRGNE